MRVNGALQRSSYGGDDDASSEGRRSQSLQSVRQRVWVGVNGAMPCYQLMGGFEVPEQVFIQGFRCFEYWKLESRIT